MLTDTAHHLRSVAASDDRFAHLEELQVRHQEGPCIEAYDTKELIGATDLEQDDRWPLFSKAAVNREVRAVLASPLPYNQDAVGVVAVLSERSRPWSPANELALLAFTDLAALLIASIIQGEQQSELAGQLQGALNSRQVIEQAKGVLMGTQGISARAAYEQLRSRARAERRKLPWSAPKWFRARCGCPEFGRTLYADQAVTKPPRTTRPASRRRCPCVSHREIETPPESSRQ